MKNPKPPKQVSSARPFARRIVMVGSALDVRGGVSAMAQVCVDHGLFRRWQATYLASHCDGSPARKALQALRAWLAFMALLLTGRVALLHAHLNSDASFWRKALFVVPASLLGVPFVLQVHCGHFATFFRERCHPRSRALVQWMLRRASHVVALSRESAAELARIAPGTHIEVIPNPVAIPEEAAGLMGEPTALFLGMLKESKGVYDLLRAWPEALAAVPNARLVLGGEGEIERARRMAKDLGIERSVETPGWVLGRTKGDLLARASVFVLPSHWEAMPMSVLEAMAAGVPVVATRVGGIPTAVEEGRTGLLVASGDRPALGRALAAILSDAALRRAMGAAGREKARAQFSADVVVPRLEALWRSVVPQYEARTPSGRTMRRRPS